MRPLALSILPDTLAIARLDPGAPLPDWALRGTLTSVTRAPDELSVVCDERAVPGGQQASRGWRAIRVSETLAFTLTGILASLATPLAEAEISIFALSTHDTDYVLVQEANLGRAVDVLTGAGHRFLEHKP